jgi:hypothetical protein
MSRRSIRRWAVMVALPLAGVFGFTGTASAHCDGLDGPVAKAGIVALESGDVRPALSWVPEPSETEVRGAFDHALRVRGLGGEARELADHFFLETLVRLHREGEGESYTGLKPAGRDLGPAIPAADLALESGSLVELEALLIDQVLNRLHERFEAARAGAGFDTTDVAAGRAYVAAYVPFLHYVEELYGLTTGHAHGHETAEAHEPHGH